jgi:hypothetical protein
MLIATLEAMDAGKSISGISQADIDSAACL